MRKSLDLIGWTFHKYRRECELGLSMMAGETIFTNEQQTPREVKWFSRGEEKEALCDAYSSMTPHTIHLGSHPNVLGGLGWGLRSCICNKLLRDADAIYGPQQGSATQRGSHLCLSGPQVCLGKS